MGGYTAHYIGTAIGVGLGRPCAKKGFRVGLCAMQQGRRASDLEEMMVLDC